MMIATGEIDVIVKANERLQGMRDLLGESVTKSRHRQDLLVEEFGDRTRGSSLIKPEMWLLRSSNSCLRSSVASGRRPVMTEQTARDQVPERWIEDQERRKNDAEYRQWRYWHSLEQVEAIFEFAEMKAEEARAEERERIREAMLAPSTVKAAHKGVPPPVQIERVLTNALNEVFGE